MILPRDQAILKAQKAPQADESVFWADGSKQSSQKAGARIAYQPCEVVRAWKTQGTYLGKNREILDAEMWAILDALKLAPRKSPREKTQFTVWTDFQRALKRLEMPSTSEPGQAIATQIQTRAQELMRK